MEVTRTTTGRGRDSGKITLGSAKATATGGTISTGRSRSPPTRSMVRWRTGTRNGNGMETRSARR